MFAGVPTGGTFASLCPWPGRGTSVLLIRRDDLVGNCFSSFHRISLNFTGATCSGQPTCFLHACARGKHSGCSVEDRSKTLETFQGKYLRQPSSSDEPDVIQSCMQYMDRSQTASKSTARRNPVPRTSSLSWRIGATKCASGHRCFNDQMVHLEC